jgi:phospholipase C
MRSRPILALFGLSWLAVSSLVPGSARADGDLGRVNHIVVMMQENRSFDNYFGALPYVPGGPYHPCFGTSSRSDHRCVEGLTCTAGASGELTCSNYNPSSAGETIFAFHNRRICGLSGLDHGWPASHSEANWEHPGDTFRSSPNDGFVRQNESDNPHQDVAHETIGFFTQAELPFYYSLAQTFAIDDRYHASVIGPTLPNRLYFMAATSFGHTTTGEAIPPIPDGYRPITGTLLDLMDAQHVSWMSYYSDLPASAYLRPFLSEHLAPISQFAADLAAGHLADVTYVDPDFGIVHPSQESDEAPPNSIRKGQYFVAQNVAAIRNSAFWKDTIIIITYDEHGGCYDHVAPPKVRQHHRRTPDGIFPGQCADLSNPPASEERGEGANCGESMDDALSTCPSFTPTGAYPRSCPSFDQYGFRVPFMVVSPFAKPHYVSHTLGDHTSLVALIEKRFMSRGGGGRRYPTLTTRDARADTLEDLFDFDHAPSLNAAIPTAPPPSPDDEGCGSGSPSAAFVDAARLTR